MKRLFLALAIGWVLFIFYQGTRTGEVSMEKSNEIVEQIIKIIEKPKSSNTNTISTSEETSTKPTTKEEQSVTSKLYTTLSYGIRKGAHFFEYLILALLLYGTLKFYPFSGVNRVIYVLFMVLGVAVLDEYFQSLVARTSSVSDVLLDFSGGAIGLIVLRLVEKIKLKS